MFRQLFRPVVRNIRQRGSRRYHDEIASYKPPTMDELPVPQGSWQQMYDSKQKTYNMQLAAGLIYSIGTITYIGYTGAIYFNWAPPTPKTEQ